MGCGALQGVEFHAPGAPLLASGLRGWTTGDRGPVVREVLSIEPDTWVQDWVQVRSFLGLGRVRRIGIRSTESRLLRTDQMCFNISELPDVVLGDADLLLSAMFQLSAGLRTRRSHVRVVQGAPSSLGATIHIDRLVLLTSWRITKRSPSPAAKR